MRRLLLLLIPLAMLPSLLRSGTVDAAQQKQVSTVVHQAVSAKPAEATQYAGQETCALCHTDLTKKFSSNPHSALALMHGGKGVTCESCHGPGEAHVESGGDPTKILQLSKVSAKQIDATCLGCHASAHPNFLRSQHAKNEVGCESCHSIHGPIPAASQIASTASPAAAAMSSAAASTSAASDAPLSAGTAHAVSPPATSDSATPADPSLAALTTLKKPSLGARLFATLKPNETTRDPLQWASTSIDVPGQNPKLLRASQPQLCYSCHTDVKAAFAQPFHHKVDEGLMSCSDCHDTHGTFQGKQLRSSADQNATCVKCHSETAGPFVYEHTVVKTDGCIACHSPHGSPNARLLNVANVNTMCLQCHSSINLAAFPNTPSEQGGPVHNQATQYVACTNCHTQIHGSNATYNLFR